MHTIPTQKSLAVVIILLFLGTAIIPSTAQNIEKSPSESRGHWLYVGGGGPGNYSIIQDAVDNASAGDTVFVYHDSSPYNENIVINTTLTLLGENQTTTQLDGRKDSHTITVNAPQTVISGFTITQPSDSFDSYDIFLKSGNSTIIGNILISNRGVSCPHARVHSYIAGNTFRCQYAFNIISVEDWIIQNNTLQSTFLSAVHVKRVIITNNFMVDFDLLLSGDANAIINNTVVGESSHHGSIQVTGGTNNDVVGNRLFKSCFSLRPEALGVLANNTVNNKPFVLLNREHGVVVEGAGQVACYNCNNITVKNLTIFDVDVGIYLEHVTNSTFENNSFDDCGSCFYWTCENCRFFNNTMNHSQLGAGIQGNHSVFKFNTFNYDSSGLFSYGLYDDDEYNTFIGSSVTFGAPLGLFAHNIVQNCSVGIDVWAGGGTVRDNTIQNCQTGIKVGTTYGITFSHNNFLNNHLDAKFMNAFLLHWEENYWGRPLFRPKIIPGYFTFWYILIPWINVDWHPAKEPYDIPRMR